MNNTADINEYIESLISSHRMADQVAYRAIMREESGSYGFPEHPLPEEIQKILAASGIEKMYQHQAQAIDIIRKKQHVVVATPTASGKSLIYTIPVLENIINYPESKAIYLFPLKALAQDQLRAFGEFAAHCKSIKATGAIYDGDTSAYHRKRIRTKPPHVLMTNPEMLHLSLLPYHHVWAEFFSALKIVVVDEVHTYRGLLGSHLAQVFRRFLRICAFYGASPTFIFSSATVANPAEISEQLTGLRVTAVTKSGAPKGRKHVVMMNPDASPSRTAILLLKAALHRGLRTIVYAQSRKMTELIAVWAGSKAGAFANRISAYRAGFLPEERREIEAKLSSGELLAVISTSALELGIDVGDLDLCLLIGYPGTIVAMQQRGGRVGRGGQDSAMILIAGEDALDQYFMRNPEELMNRESEAAVVNPFNPYIMEKHLICAASEMPIKTNEPFMAHPAIRRAVSDAERKGLLFRSADGQAFYSNRKRPQREVDLRGTGVRFSIICSETGKHKGDVDGFRAFRETHPGAVYLHNGETYIVENLDLDTRIVRVRAAEVSYYTKVRASKDTEILEIFDEKPVHGTRVCMGRLKVTDQVNGYDIWHIHPSQKISSVELTLPPNIFETEGLWIDIPIEIQREIESQMYHFMGGIHAIEHAAIGIFPLLVMADRNDLGGISTPYHQQTGGAAVFIYDATPGGSGLSREAFHKAEKLLSHTLNVIDTCGCENGCPSCVYSPKCGAGNKPIDKTAATVILNGILKNRAVPFRAKPVLLENRQSQKDAENTEKYYGVLDVETRRSAEEVGGWHHADRMGISCAVLYDSREDRFFEFLQEDIYDLIKHLRRLEMVVGFNIKKFDYQVLGGCYDFDFSSLPTLDILEHVYQHLNYRLSLDSLAKATLETQKSGDGLLALRLWKQRRIREIIEYCTSDVRITRDLFLYGRKNGYLLFTNKAGNTVRLPVNFNQSPP